MFFRLSIFKKMLLPPLLAVVLFALYVLYIYINQKENEKQINSIHQIHFPVMNIANENIILLENCIRAFEDSVAAKEEAWLENTKTNQIQLLKNIDNLSSLGINKSEIKSLKTSFLSYFDVTYKLSHLLIEDKVDWHEIEVLTKQMRNNLKDTQSKFLQFQTTQKNKFDLTIKNTNKQVSEIFYTGISIAIISLILILILTFFFSISTKKSLKELLYSVKNMAEGNPNFSKRISKNSNDELGELVEQFNIFTNKLQGDYEELNIAKKDAESANKIKSEFIANMSHEIRTPLNAIIGFSELLNKTEVSSRQKNYLKSIIFGGNTLLSIINDILDISKIEAGKIEIIYKDLHLEQFINDIKAMFEQKIEEKNLSFEINIDKNLPKAILMDEIRLRQILLNIIGNAVKFTHEGSIKLNIKSEASKENRTNLLIEVKDTGIGIPVSQQSKIFESFVQQEGQSNRQYEGTGLGLAICLKLVKMINGDIKLLSKENIGSTFTILLNDVEISTNYLEEKTLFYEEEIEFEKTNILVVDDVQINRDLIIASLENKNLDIYEAQNGQEAIEVCNKNEIDLVFMDIKMPILNGIDATKILKKKEKKPFIVALTTSLRIKEMGELVSLFDGYMTKPINYEILIKELKKFISFKSVSSKKIENKQTLLLEKTCVNEFKDEFESSIKNSWQKASQGCSFEDILEFSNILHTFAKEYKQKDIEEFANSLEKAVENFDIKSIENQIADFAKFLKEIEND